MSTNSQKGDHAGLSHSFKFSAQWVKFLLSVDIQDETLSGRLQELKKTMGKPSCVIPKVIVFALNGNSRLQELSIRELI